MPDWQRLIAPTAHKVEKVLDRLKYDLYDRLGGPGPIKIIPYRGFGSRSRIYLKGRVLVDKGISPASDTHSLWRNLADTYKRLSSREVPHARLRIRFQERDFELEADEEGMFVVDIEPSRPPDPRVAWHDLDIELLEPTSKEQPGPVRATGKVLIPSQQAGLAVISDIDDTVLVTSAANVLKAARTLFLKNARTRLPFPGVAAFYRALARGSAGEPVNPLFYVSSSPWNLYDLLADFLHFQEFPDGPVLFLRNYGISDREILPTQHREYKVGAIRRIMDMSPQLPFILFGDSGQEDPEIYSEIIDRYPRRILAVYIRNVSRHPRRAQEIRELARQAVASGSALVLADDTEAMARHALENGWIRPEEIPEILREKEKDIAPPSPIERLLGEEEEPEPSTVTLAGQEAEQGAIEETLSGADPDRKAPPDVVVEPEEQP